MAPLLDGADLPWWRGRAHRADRPQRHRQVDPAAASSRARSRSTMASCSVAMVCASRTSSRSPRCRLRRRCARALRRARVAAETADHAGSSSRGSTSTWTVSGSIRDVRRAAVGRRAQARGARARVRARARPAAARRADQSSRHRGHRAAREQLLRRRRPRSSITHDRAFLDRVVTRIVELDRGVLRSYPGNFAAYERARTTQLADEAVANRHFDKFWAQEEAWIRKGVEARRTRNEGRVRRLRASCASERAARRERIGDRAARTRRRRALGSTRRRAGGREQALWRARRSCDDSRPARHARRPPRPHRPERRGQVDAAAS